MGRYEVGLPPRLVAVLLGMLLLSLPSCNGKSPATPSAEGTAHLSAPAGPPADEPPELLAQLRQSLSAEFERLGIDPDKVAAAAPSGADNAVFNLAATVIDPDGPPDGHGGGEQPPTGIELRWTERMIGDYDQNGEVNYSDITPLGQHFNAVVNYDEPGMHGGFEAWPAGDPEDTGGTSPPDPSSGAANWRMARIDGEANGELNFGDVTPLAVHWMERMDGYQIERAINYGTGVLVWETAPLDIGYGDSPSAPRAELSTHSAIAPVRYSATVPLTDTDHTTYFRIRPYEALSDTSGEASNVAAYYPNPGVDTTPPYWTDTLGVQRLLPYVEQITVEFGTAVDDETPPVTYRVYWVQGDAGNPDAPFDYGTAQFADVAASPYVIDGLTDGQYYRVAVRAHDNAAPSNEEQNTVLLGATPGPRDIYPPEWQGTPGLTELFYGNQQAFLAWNPAADSHNDEYGLWQSGPVVYRIYHGQGFSPNLANATIQEFTDAGLEVNVVVLQNIDTTKPHWFLVRATDQATPPNEDANMAVKTTPGFNVTSFEVPALPPELPPDEVEVSEQYCLSANQQFAGLLRDIDYSPHRDGDISQFFMIQSDGSLVLDSTYTRGNSVPQTAIHITDSGDPIFAYTQFTSGLNTGRVVVQRKSGQSVYELGDTSVSHIGITAQGKTYVKCTKAIDAFNGEFEESLAYEPFSEFHVIHHTTPGETPYLFKNIGDASLESGNVLSLFEIPESTTEDVLVEFNDSFFHSQTMPIALQSDWTLDALYGYDIQIPFFVYQRDVPSPSDDSYTTLLIRHGMTNLEYGVAPPLSSTLDVQGMRYCSSLDKYVIRGTLAIHGYIDDPSTLHHERTRWFVENGQIAGKWYVPNSFDTEGEIQYVGNGRYAYSQFVDRSQDTTTHNIVTLVD